MDGKRYTLYCNQIYQVEEKAGFFQKKQLRSFHRSVNQFPFMLNDGKQNEALFAEISNAAGVFFGNAYFPVLHGELWTVIKDHAHNRYWGLFICSNHSSAEGKDYLLNYALCPLENISSLSREELVSALMRANLIQQWGIVKVDRRVSRSIMGNSRTEALIQELVDSNRVQLVYGETGRMEIDAWMDQIWIKIQSSGKVVSSFYGYRQYELEQFLSNRFVLPKLLLFPGNPFRTLRRVNWKCYLPVRGEPKKCAQVVSISSPFADSSEYGILLFARELQSRMLALKDVPKNSGSSIQLKQNKLKNLIVQKEQGIGTGTDNYNHQYCLFHVRTKQRYPIVNNPFWIGRAQQLDCTLDNERVSKKHACITVDDHKYYIMDQSTNGTILNGNRITKNTYVLLEEGAQILIGNEAFRFQTY